MKLRCLHDGILFVLLDRITSRGVFEEETKWGLVIPAGNKLQGKDHSKFQEALQKGRWAKVLTIGPECKEVEVGDYVCIEPQMWTNAFDYDNITIRKTDESKVMLVSKEKPEIRI